jgi:hypothetical protein
MMKRSIVGLFVSCSLLHAGYTSYDWYDADSFWDIRETLVMEELIPPFGPEPDPSDPGYDESEIGSPGWHVKQQRDIATGSADSDFDGLLDIEEYIFGYQSSANEGGYYDEVGQWVVTNPDWQREVQNPAGLHARASSQGGVELVCKVITGSTDVSYWYEGSHDLKTWKALSISSVKVLGAVGCIEDPRFSDDPTNSCPNLEASDLQGAQQWLAATISAQEAAKYRCYR